jgi:hypothetical protein
MLSYCPRQDILGNEQCPYEQHHLVSKKRRQLVRAIVSQVHASCVYWLRDIGMNRHPCAKKDGSKTTPYNAQQCSTVVNVLARG